MRIVLALVLLGGVAHAEKLSGNVVVTHGVTLHPTVAAARAATGVAHSRGVAYALRVVREHGDVVEVSTAPVKDCLPSYQEPYQLTTFVRRDQLLARSKQPIAKTFGDGSALAIDRGAPVANGAWHSPLLAATGVPVGETVLALVPGKPQTLPPSGPRLVCEWGPQTVAEWKAETEKRRTGREFDIPPADERAAPWCTVLDPTRYAVSPPTVTPPPTLDGKPIAWPDDQKRGHVVAHGQAFLGDFDVPCGRLRVVVERASVRAVPGGASMGVGGKVTAWVPSAGRVTWPDGKPAGTYKGTFKYGNVVEKGNRICVRVAHVAELVCHAKRTTRTEQVSPLDVE